MAAVFIAHHAALLKAMALEGRGVAWLPQSLIPDELHLGTLVPAAGAEWNVPVEIRLYRQHVTTIPAAEVLWAQATGP